MNNKMAIALAALNRPPAYIAQMPGAVARQFGGEQYPTIEEAKEAVDRAMARYEEGTSGAEALAGWHGCDARTKAKAEVKELRRYRLLLERAAKRGA